MCGICGVWGTGGEGAVRAMVTALRHRGPDDSGTHSTSGATVGITRLAIIDRSSGGHQPMISADKKIALVYNGELYNFREERRVLEKLGYGFRSESDTEVVLRMYEHYGSDFLLRMRGMFALAIIDSRKGPGRERLLLARDQMGIKPLIYARVQNCLVFASEIKALLASGLVAPEVDPIAVRVLLTYGSVYQPRTILRGVRTLPAAHRLIIDGVSEERVERYWTLDLDRHRGLRQRAYEEQVEEVSKVLQDSVRLQMTSDVPLGAFLSGGVDSSLLVSLMARAAIDRRLQTFSVGFESEGRDIDETDDAERTAAFLGTDHTRVIVRGTHVRDRIRSIAFALDQPTVDGVNSYFVSAAARQGVTVAISGTGGDELFAGYPWFRQMVMDHGFHQSAPWKSLAKSIIGAAARRPLLNQLAPKPGGHWLMRFRDGASFLSRYYATNGISSVPLAAKLLSTDLRDEAQAGRSPHDDLQFVDEVPRGSVIERVTGLCLRGYTANQLLRDIDAASMSHSLEVRVPFLDPLVTDAALSLPDSTKMSPFPEATSGSYRETGTKRILLDMGKDLLPDGFDLKTKRGFSMPFDHWLKGPLRDVLLDTLSNKRVKERGLLNSEAVVNIRDRFLAGDISWTQPWICMMLELWAQEVLDCSAAELTARLSEEAVGHSVASAAL